MSGWIKLHRKFTEWEWYTDINTKSLFLHLLLCANHRDSKYQGKDVKRGQIVTGRKKLSVDTGISEQSIRTSLTKLVSTNEITIETTNQNSLITIIKYDLYQRNDINSEQSTSGQPAEQPTNQPTINQQLTTNKNIKEYKEEKNKERSDFFDENNEVENVSPSIEFGKRFINSGYIDSDEWRNLTNEISSFFSISEIHQSNHYSQIGNFVRLQESKGNIEYLKKQFYAYRDIKKGSEKRFIHKWYTYIGSKEKSYEDGAWNKEDYSSYIDQESKLNEKVLPRRTSRRNPS